MKPPDPCDTLQKLVSELKEQLDVLGSQGQEDPFFPGPIDIQAQVCGDLFPRSKRTRLTRHGWHRVSSAHPPRPSQLKLWRSHRGVEGRSAPQCIPSKPGWSIQNLQFLAQSGVTILATLP